MKPLYTEQNLEELKKQINRRWAIWLALLAAGVVGLTVLLVMDNHKTNRPELAATLVVLFTGIALIAFYDLLIHPLAAYRRHMNNSLHGRSHEAVVIFDHLNEEVSVVEGVTFRDMIFLGEADKHGDRERMFYWDQELPLPSFSKGQEVTLKYYDRFITGYSC